MTQSRRGNLDLAITLAFALGLLTACAGDYVEDVTAQKDRQTLDRTIDEPVAAPEESPQIVRDERGVPHIQADTLQGAFYALGFAQAEDRLFQMHFRRSFMAGRLSEFFEQPGVDDALLQDDVRMRVLGFERNARRTLDNLSEHHRALLDAYSQGVNAQIAQRRGDLGEAFEEFGLTEIPAWEASDSLLVWDFVTYKFGDPVGSMNKELDNLLDCEDGGCDAPKCAAVVDEDAAVVPPPLEASLLPDLQGVRTASHPTLEHRPGVNIKASHGFVVSADKTTQGAPLLFAEPQIVMEAPSTWHEHHLQVASAGINARGVGFAGAPGFAIFWNEHIAQTLTAGAGDLADLFEITPGHGDSYVVDGKLRRMNVIDETILVRGQAPVRLQVRETFHGPIINDALMPTGDTDRDQAVRELFGQRLFAVRLAEHFETHTHSIVAAIDLISAHSLKEYQDALEHWVGPTVNALYAGVDKDSGQSHIAYHALVGIGERSPLVVDGFELTGQHPYDGSRTRTDWRSILDLRWQPSVVDPEEGYLFSGNHLPVGRWYDDVVYTGLGGNGDTYRSLQLRVILDELMSQGEPIDERTLHNVHFNTESWAAERFLDALRALEARGEIPADDPDRDPVNRRQRAARVKTALERWVNEGGAQLDQRAVAAPLVADVLRAMITLSRVSKDRAIPAEEEFGCIWGGAEGGASHFFKAFAQDPEVLGEVETRTIIRVASAAWLDVTEADDKDPTELPVDVRRWEGLTEPTPVTVHYQRNFYCFFGDDPCSLDEATPFDVAISASYVHTINSAYGSSYPATVMFHDIQQSRAMLPPGVSERPSSPRFANTMDLLEAKGAGDTASIPRAPLAAPSDLRPLTLTYQP